MDDDTFYNLSISRRLHHFSLRHEQTLDNVDEAMSQVRSVQDREDRSEEVIRAKVRGDHVLFVYDLPSDNV